MQSKALFSIREQLQPFAELSRNSREFQGHGWGCSWLPEDNDGAPALMHGFVPHDTSESNASFDGKWWHYHNINPIWDCDFSGFGMSRLLLVHARSAFRDEGIYIENNMPFSDGDSVFIFNGELRGVKIKSAGRIGAEKIYNYIRRMDNGDKQQAVEKSTRIINKRSSYVRAMNILLSDGNSSVVSTLYNETPDYFQMHRNERKGITRVCSQPFPGETGWERIGNHSTEEITCT